MLSVIFKSITLHMRAQGGSDNCRFKAIDFGKSSVFERLGNSLHLRLKIGCENAKQTNEDNRFNDFQGKIE